VIPRQYSLVRFTPSGEENFYPFAFGSNLHKWPLLFLGEIPNMPNHCAVADKTGKVYFGWHTENFTEIPEEET